jgi:hypothetical protein
MSPSAAHSLFQAPYPSPRPWFDERRTKTSVPKRLFWPRDDSMGKRALEGGGTHTWLNLLPLAVSQLTAPTGTRVRKRARVRISRIVSYRAMLVLRKPGGPNIPFLAPLTPPFEVGPHEYRAEFYAHLDAHLRFSSMGIMFRAVLRYAATMARLAASQSTVFRLAFFSNPGSKVRRLCSELRSSCGQEITWSS